MVMRSSTRQGRWVRLMSPALSGAKSYVVRVDGQEGLSQLFRYEISFLVEKKDLDLAECLAQPAALAIKKPRGQVGRSASGIVTACIHGIFSFVEEREKEGNSVLYHAVLVPRLWKLSLHHDHRIFLDKSVPEVLQEILKQAGFTPKDFELRLQQSYPKKEYVVQYGESDLNFISRLLEHAGIFFFFEHDDDQVVFGDSPNAYGLRTGEESIAYNPRGTRGDAQAEAWDEQPVASSVVARQTQLPKEILLQDYNYRTPSVDIRATEKIGKEGWGRVYEYGSDYANSGEGKALAKVRSEEWLCREMQFIGVSTCRGLHAGGVFSLENHYRGEWNRKYVALEVRHTIEGAVSAGSHAAPFYSHSNDFTAVPAEVPFRPERQTPMPKIPGVISAKIDAAGDGKYAEVDDQGRYKVWVSFDVSGRKDGKASLPVRMAQPYVGAGYGMHFPLHKGTEVLVGHEGGDLDRPVILGAVADSERSSVVLDQNHTECVLRSGGNNSLVFDDLEGSERWFAHAQKNQEIQVKNDALECVGNDRHLVVKHDRIEHVQNDRHETIDRDLVQKVTGKWHRTVTGNVASDVMGNLSTSVKGNVAQSYMGNHHEQTVGNFSLSSMMAVIDAPMGITLKSGASYVVINPTGVSINGPAIHLVGGAILLNTGPGLPPGVAVPLVAEMPISPLTAKEPGSSEVGGAGTASSEAAPTEETMAKGKPGQGGGAAKRGAAKSAAGGIGALAGVAGGAAAGAEETAAQRDGADEKKSGKKNWIGIRLKGKDGKPVPHESYRLKLPDGRELSGKLDGEGKAYVDGVEGEKCLVTFPAIDKGRWRRC